MLPQTNPPSLRILPARSSFREARVSALSTEESPHPAYSMPVKAHWRGIETTSVLERLPVAIAFCRFFSVLTKCALRSPTQWVCQITQFHSAQIGAFSAPEVP